MEAGDACGLRPVTNRVPYVMERVGECKDKENKNAGEAGAFLWEALRRRVNGGMPRVTRVNGRYETDRPYRPSGGGMQRACESV